MTNSYQRAVRNRKLLYFGMIAGLFAVTFLVRGIFAMPAEGAKDGAAKWTIQAQSDRLDLNEMSQGEVELTGSAVRLLLTGSRGLAVCALWMSAQEKQKRHEWNEMELTVKSVTKLQPHFIVPWLFQSWNLSYNVSVEMDRLNDMYFYIARGISLLAEGESINRNNPDIRYQLAFYYQMKFTVSDKVTTLRCLFQLSCIPKQERDYRNLMQGDQVNLEAFKAFCEKNPSLVRRLRETAIRYGKDANGNELPAMFLVQSPKDVVDFLKDNESVPSRFRDDAPDRLGDRLKQFPVLPPPFYREADDELNPEAAIGDGKASGVRAARVWFRYANEVIPEPNPEPSFPPRNYRDPQKKRRMPLRPTLMIFRQGPPRSQSFVAEQTSKDGWWDKDPWVVDAQRDSSDRWFKEDVIIQPSCSSQEEWSLAHRMWEEHGRANGLHFFPNELERYKARARPYASRRGINIDTIEMAPLPRADEEQDESLADSIAACRSLFYLTQNLRDTNYEFFLFQAQFEMDPETIKARKIFYEAALARKYNKVRDAIALYEEALGTQEKPGLWGQLLLKRNIRNTNDRLADKLAEDTAEQQINYLRLIADRDEKKLRKVTPAFFLQLGGLGGASPFSFAFNDLLLNADGIIPLQQPIWPPGPYDGVDPSGMPWVPEHVWDRVRMAMGMTKPGVAKKKESDAAPPTR